MHVALYINLALLKIFVIYDFYLLWFPDKTLNECKLSFVASDHEKESLTNFSNVDLYVDFTVSLFLQ